MRLGTKDLRTFSQVFGGMEYDSFTFTSDPKFIIDGGGNIGLAAIFFARKFPTAKVFTIEPSSENFEILKKNVSAYPNIVPIHAALWHEEGTIDLLDPGAGSWGFETSESSTRTDIPIMGQVTALTVSGIITKYGLDGVDLLKLDIEGSEKELLSDCANWINSVKLMIVELHEGSRKGCKAAWEASTHDFPDKWKSGENECAARNGVCVRQKVAHA